MLSEIKYARSGDVNIAYEAIGDGPIDLVIVHGWVATIEAMRGAPGFVLFAQRLASFSRVIQFDACPTGSLKQPQWKNVWMMCALSWML